MGKITKKTYVKEVYCIQMKIKFINYYIKFFRFKTSV